MNFLDSIYIPKFRRTNFQSKTMRETSSARLNAFQNFVIAGSSGALARASVNGYSVLKICAEVGVPGHKMGPVQAFYWTVRLEGIGAFSKGLIPAVLRSFPHIGIQFTIFDQLAKRYVPVVPPKKAPTIYATTAIYFIGGIAGSTATVVTHPLDLIKTRIVCQGMGHPTVYKGIADCAAKIIKSDGIFGLYRGIIPSVVGAFVFSGEMFMLWDLFLRVPWMRRDKPYLPLEWFFWPVVAVATATAFTHPIDVFRRKIMAYDPKLPRSGGGDIRVRGLLQTVFDIYKFYGLPGFMQGFVTNMIKVLPQVAVFWIAYRGLQNITFAVSPSPPPSKQQAVAAAT